METFVPYVETLRQYCNEELLYINNKDIPENNNIRIVLNTHGGPIKYNDFMRK